MQVFSAPKYNRHCLATTLYFGHIPVHSISSPLIYQRDAARRLSDKLGVKILNAPEYVRNIVLSQDSVDYILEQKRPAFVVPVDSANRVTPDSI